MHFPFYFCRPTFIEICREKSVLGFQALPYLVALFSSMLWPYYAFLKVNVALLITINSFGCLIETIYIMIYLVYMLQRMPRYIYNCTGVNCAGTGMGTGQARHGHRSSTAQARVEHGSGTA